MSELVVLLKIVLHKRIYCFDTRIKFPTGLRCAVNQGPINMKYKYAVLKTIVGLSSPTGLS
jgi:hypothetical protein